LLYLTTILILSLQTVKTSRPHNICSAEDHSIEIYSNAFRTLGKGFEYDPNESIGDRLIRCKNAIDEVFVDHVREGIPTLTVAQVGTFLGTHEIFDYLCLSTDPRIPPNFYVPLNSHHVANVTANPQCTVFASTVQSGGFYYLLPSDTPPILIRLFHRAKFSGNRIVTLDSYYDEIFVFLDWLGLLQKETNILDSNADWCEVINNNCASTLTGYCTPLDSVPNCVDCTTFLNSIEQISPLPGNSNSAGCRILYAGMTDPRPEVTMIDPTANYRNCLRAGYSGGGVCVGPF